jgi:hypothetical protein
VAQVRERGQRELLLPTSAIVAANDVGTSAEGMHTGAGATTAAYTAYQVSHAAKSYRHLIVRKGAPATGIGRS